MEAEESSHLSKKGMKTYNNAMDEAKEKLSSAVAEWTIYTKHDPVNAWLVLSKLRDALFALERFDEIEIILKNILSVAPDNVDAMESLANYYFQKGENTNASELAEQVIDMDETSIVANLIRLKIDVQTKESRALLQDIDRLIDLMSKDEDLHHQRQQIDSDIRWLFKSTGDLEKFRD
jgi:tetratricopeptide (TPR) repeat protein